MVQPSFAPGKEPPFVCLLHLGHHLLVRARSCRLLDQAPSHRARWSPLVSKLCATANVTTQLMSELRTVPAHVQALDRSSLCPSSGPFQLMSGLRTVPARVRALIRPSFHPSPEPSPAFIRAPNRPSSCPSAWPSELSSELRTVPSSRPSASSSLPLFGVTSS